MDADGLRRWMAERQLTQEAAARKIGVSLRTLSRWLAGQHSPSRLALEKLTHLGVKK